MSLNHNLNFHKAKVVLAAGLSFVLGVAVASYSSVFLETRTIFILGWLALLPTFYMWPKRSALVCLVVASFMFGIWRYQFFNEMNSNDLRWWRQQQFVVVGQIKTEPEISDNSQKIIAEAEKINGSDWVKGKFVLFRPLDENYNYGDKILADCWLEEPKASDNFNAERYWRRFGVAGTCQTEAVKIVGKNKGSWFYARIIEVRRLASKLIKNGLPYPEADLGGAMVLGVGNKLNAELKNSFSQSGLTHIIAISGLNVSLLVALLFGGFLFLGLRRQWCLVLSLIAVVGYVVLVGAPASAVRAGIMGVMFLLAAAWGRLNKLINALVLAAGLSLAFNPLLLRDDIGWQLSFLALLGIIYVYPLLRLFLKNSCAWLDLLLDGLSLTVAAQLATWPVIAFNFGQVSLIAPFANLLAVWTTPFILVGVFGALVLSSVWSWWGWWLPAWVFLKYLISVALLSAGLPGASLMLNQKNSMFLIVYYLFLISAVLLAKKFLKKEKEALSR